LLKSAVCVLVFVAAGQVYKTIQAKSTLFRLHAGLVQRQSGGYSHSSFGKIVYDALVIIGNALEKYWKLAAIDSVQDLPEIERNKIIEVLIDNPQIRESLLKDAHHKVMENNDHNNNNGNNRGQGQMVAKKYAFS
jgi:TusA-related sulfurtransferase